jgi:hypothetical protein
MPGTFPELNPRERSTLLAIAAGRVAANGPIPLNVTWMRSAGKIDGHETKLETA